MRQISCKICGTHAPADAFKNAKSSTRMYVWRCDECKSLVRWITSRGFRNGDINQLIRDLGDPVKRMRVIEMRSGWQTVARRES